MNQVIQVIIYIYFKEEALVPVLTKTFVIVEYIISLHHVFIFLKRKCVFEYHTI